MQPAMIDEGKPDEPEDVTLTADEERGIIEAVASIEAGYGLPFEGVMRDLETEITAA